MKVSYNITQNKFNASLNQEVTEIKLQFQNGYYPLPVSLENYYTKDETYSKTEVDDIIAEIPVVDTSNLVPYTGANKDVNIASNYFETSQGFKKTGGTHNLALTADGGTFDLNDKADLIDGKIPSSQLPSYTATDVDALKRDGSNANSNIDIGEFQLKAGQIEFDQTPTQSAGVAKLRWNDSDGTLDLGLKGGNVTLQIGQEQVVRVVNKTGSNFLESNYQAVRVSGAQGQRLKVGLAQATNDLLSAETIGLVTENINNNQEGFVTTSGLIRGVNTTGSLQGETWEDGDMLYLSPFVAGRITNIKPSAPNHLIVVGYVVYAHANNGSIFVKVDNGYELEELHNVTETNYTTPIDTDSLLTFDVTNSLWKRLTWANIKANLKTYFDSIYTTSSAVASQITNALTGYATKAWVNTGLETKQDKLQDTTGNIGVGKTDASATEKLDVNGNIKAFGFKTPSGTATQSLTANGGTFDLNTKADLVDGKVPSSQLPSYVDDVLEFANLASFPATGESGKIYIAIDTNITYRWTGNGYAEISASLALGETASTAYRGDRGKIAYDHSQTIGNPHGTTKSDIGLENVDNTSDLNKPISTATQTALNSKQDNLGYTPENIANKSDSYTVSSYTTYASTKALVDGLATKQNILTNPITGTGTTNYIPKLTSSGTVGNSVIYDDGTNVGIGTTSPSYILDLLSSNPRLRVKDSSTGYSLLDLENESGSFYVGADSSTGSLFGGSAYAGTLYRSGAYPISMWTNGSERMRITSGGNVGIGTSSPVQKLHVEGLSYFGSDMFTNTEGGIFFSGNNTYTVGTYSRGNNLVLQAGGYERIRITSDGNVGIGTTLPANQLHISSATNGVKQLIQTYDSNIGSYTGLMFKVSATAEDSYKKAGVFFERTNAASVGKLHFALNSIIDATNASLSDAKMTILPSGNVGIGTTSPSEKLDVNGNVLVQGLLKLKPQTSAPTGVEGAIYYNSTTKKHYGFDGTTWNALY